MSGVIPLFPLYAFMAWIWTNLLHRLPHVYRTRVKYWSQNNTFFISKLKVKASVQCQDEKKERENYTDHICGCTVVDGRQ